MYLKIILVCTLIIFYPFFSSGQVKVRLFSNHLTESAVFSVTQGKYELKIFNRDTVLLSEGEAVIITIYNGKLAVKPRNSQGFTCDSVMFTGKTGNDSFSIRINGNSHVRQFYSGDFECFSDLGTLVMINNCNIEKYIAGVVWAEGGSGWNKEYFKTQAVITRTYLYRYFDKHHTDKYNVCDNTHCQVYNGISYDAIINLAALETHGLVLLDNDSTLIISAFHSNCGGETSLPENVWLTGLSYLKRVVDPYCLSSGNARWEKRMPLSAWIDFIKKSGYKGRTDDPSVFTFLQDYRLTDYRAGSFTVPLGTIRSEMHLKSTFFSVFVDGDTIILKGRGFGHGVGLCQEGAMEMAKRGFNYHQIIDFYYNNVLISDIRNCKSDTPQPPKRGANQMKGF